MKNARIAADGVKLADHVSFADELAATIDKTGPGQARNARYRAIYDRLRYIEAEGVVFDPVTSFHTECKFLFVLGLIDTIANREQG